MRILSTAAATLLVATLLALPVGPAQAAEAAAALAPKCKGREVTILGTDDGETLRGTNKRDVILALDGDDRIDGRGGNDVICGGAGRDLINGGPGHDKIFGGGDGRSENRSPDGVRLMVGDVVQGGPGDDLIDLGYDERQKTFGSVQRDRLSYKGSAFRVVVTLGTPKGRGQLARRRPGPPGQAPVPRPARVRQGRRADRVDVRRPDPRARWTPTTSTAVAAATSWSTGHRRRTSVTTCWTGGSAATS